MSNLQDYGPKPLVINIEEATLDNENFRTALWTGAFSQTTLMTIQPGDDIGLEVHEDHDQFLRIEEGEARVELGDSEDTLEEFSASDDFAIFVPAGTWHNLTVVGTTPLKLYSIYSPAEHPHGTVHVDKAEADAYEAEHHGH